MRRILSVAAFLTALPAFAAHAQSAGGPLLQPGESYPTAQPGEIQLHPPKAAHKHEPAKYKLVLTPPLEISGSAQPDEIHLHLPDHAVRSAHSTRAKAAGTQTASTQRKSRTAAPIPFSFDENNSFAARPAEQSAPASPPPPPARVASLPPRSAPSQPAPSQPVVPKQVAAPAGGERANMTKRAAIMFDRGALAPSPVQFKALKMLASTLNSALESGASGVQLEAYGGSPGDKSSDARRVALKRALAVRQLLIDDGVPSARISVRAMGGADDKGPPDRVDVFVRVG